MPIIKFSREQLCGAAIREEQYAILTALVDLDLRDKYASDKYVRPLLGRRLRELDEERLKFGLSEVDLTKYAEAEAEIEIQAEFS